MIARIYTGGQKWLCGVILERTGPVSYKIKIDSGVIRRHIDQILQYKPLSVQDSTMNITNFESPVEIPIPVHENPVIPIPTPIPVHENTVIPPVQIEQSTQQPVNADRPTVTPTHVEAGTPEHESVGSNIQGSYVQMPVKRSSVASNSQTQASIRNSLSPKNTSASTVSSRPVRVRNAPKYLKDYVPK